MKHINDLLADYSTIIIKNDYNHETGNKVYEYITHCAHDKTVEVLYSRLVSDIRTKKITVLESKSKQYGQLKIETVNNEQCIYFAKGTEDHYFDSCKKNDSKLVRLSKILTILAKYSSIEEWWNSVSHSGDKSKQWAVLSKLLEYSPNLFTTGLSFIEYHKCDLQHDIAKVKIGRNTYTLISLVSNYDKSPDSNTKVVDAIELNGYYKIDNHEGKEFWTVKHGYERNRWAVLRCLKEKGYVCAVCNIDYTTRYKSLGKKAIEVHHDVPLYKYKGGHYINLDELYPICSNCHSILHRGGQMVETIESLRTYLKRKH